MKLKNISKNIIAFKLDRKSHSIAPGNSISVLDKYEDEVREIASRRPGLQVIYTDSKTHLTRLDGEEVNLIRRIQSMINNLKTNDINRIKRKTVHWVSECAKHTTVGGSALEVISLPSVKSDMMVSVTLTEEGSVPVTIKTAKCIDGAVEVTFSADPSNDHKIDYIITKHSI